MISQGHSVKKNPNTIALSSLLLASALTTSLPAQADLITYGTNFSNSGSLFSISDRYLKPFDPSLGTLNTVNMFFIGNLVVTGTYASNFVFTPSPVPSPYTVQTQVRHTMDGLFSLSSFGFGFPATFIYDGFAPGVPSPFTFVTPITYNITFDDLSELVGFAVHTNFGGPTIPPLMITGDRDDFEKDFFSDVIGGLWVQSRLETTFVSALQPQDVSTSLNGSLLLTYNYTPFPPPPPPPTVPEPGSLALLGLGLMGLGLSRRKRRQRH